MVGAEILACVDQLARMEYARSYLLTRFIILPEWFKAQALRMIED